MSYLSDKLQAPINYFDLLIKFNSFLLILITFFGLRIPFQTGNYVMDYSQEASNIQNQIFYFYLFFSTLFILIKRFNKTYSFIRAEKYLSLFILLCLGSAIWSDYSYLSIKRSFQLFVIFFVIVEVLINIEPGVLLKQLKIVVSLYLFYNLYACRFIPLAIDPTFGTWRGIEAHKNHLAQGSLYCLLSSVVFFKFDKTRLSKLYDVALMLLAVFITFKTKSSTTFLAIVIIVFLGFIFNIEKYFTERGFGRSLSGLMLLFVLSFIVIFIIFSSDIFASVPGYFGKDLTLSGRVPIWEYVWKDVEKKLWFGYGYQTYWLMGTQRIVLFAAAFEGFRVNEAHNGYIEIMLQLGIVGAIFFLFTLIAYIRRMLKLNSNLNLAILILITMLTLNYTESVFFKTGEMGFTTLFYMASYTLISIYYFKLGKVNNDEENHQKNFKPLVSEKYFSTQRRKNNIRNY